MYLCISACEASKLVEQMHAPRCQCRLTEPALACRARACHPGQQHLAPAITKLTDGRLRSDGGLAPVCQRVMRTRVHTLTSLTQRRVALAYVVLSFLAVAAMHMRASIQTSFRRAGLFHAYTTNSPFVQWMPSDRSGPSCMGITIHMFGEHQMAWLYGSDHMQPTSNVTRPQWNQPRCLDIPILPTAGSTVCCLRCGCRQAVDWVQVDMLWAVRTSREVLLAPNGCVLGSD